MDKSLHLRDNMDRLYLSRKEAGRERASIEDSVDALIPGLDDHIKSNVKLITATRKKKIRLYWATRKQKFEKQLYGYSKQQTGEVTHEKTWT